MHHLQPRHAQRRRIARDPRRAIRIRLERDRAQRHVRQHPFDRDRAGAGADVPQRLAAARRQRRQRDGADLALGDLAVVLEQIVGQPGGARDDPRARRRHHLDRDRVERIDRAKVI
jgi:hypothetical protein